MDLNHYCFITVTNQLDMLQKPWIQLETLSMRAYVECHEWINDDAPVQ